jgi:hypothetical protein
VAKWSVHVRGGEFLGTVDAWDKPNAITAAIQAFSIPYVLQSRVIVAPAGSSGWIGLLRAWYRSRYPRSAA